MTRRRISATLCALVFLSAVAVGSAAPSKANRIGISVNSISATTQREMYYSTIKYAEAAGYQVVGLDSKGEVSKMFADMENLVAQRVDAIVNIGGNLTAMVPVIQRAARAGIPVISVDAGVVDGVAAHVTSNDWEMGGKMTGLFMDAINGKGEVFHFHNPDHFGTRSRGNVFRAALPEYPDVIVAGEHRIRWPNTIPDSRQAMENMLKAHPDVKGVYCCFDLVAVGVAQAIQAAGRKDIVVVGCDGDPLALECIKAGGPIIATVYRDTDDVGRLAVDVAVRLIKGEKLARKTFFSATTLVTQDNVDKFIAK